MNTVRKLRYVLIGEGTLPIVCGDMLLARGHEVAVVVSRDCDVVSWALTHGLAHVPSPLEALPQLDDVSVDYLLSIVNPQKLPDELLSKARIHAINYHDAPLPRYAGTHATSWALLHGEATYAVTWHAMAQRIDAGAILKQTPVAISRSDTALTLNAKCYEAAIAGFCELLGEMESGTVAPRPQNAAHRTFFRRSKRPPAGCTLMFDASSEHLGALTRALDFGSYANPLGLPKVLLGDVFAIVASLDVTQSRSGASPGTIVRLTSEHMLVSTADYDVALSGFHTTDGAAIALADLLVRENLHVGARLPALAESLAARIAVMCEELSGHEAFWREQLLRTKPLAFPYAFRSQGHSHDVEVRTLDLTPGIESIARSMGQDSRHTLLAVVIAYLARISGSEEIGIGYCDAQLLADVGDLGSIVSTCLPLHVAISQTDSFTQLVNALGVAMAQLRVGRSYMRDAPLRDPILRARLDSTEPSAWPVCVEWLDDVAAPPRPHGPGRVLTVRLGSDGRSCAFRYDPEVIDAELMGRMERQLRFFLQCLPDLVEQPIHTLPVLPSDERRRLLIDLNSTASDFPSDRCLHELIEDQVARTPHAIAVKHEEDAISYAELNIQANRLAHYLLSLSTSPGDRIAICLERGLPMVVALLATLKASAAYVPIEPSYPYERLVRMIEDSAPVAVVVDTALFARYPQLVDALRSCKACVIDVAAPVAAWNREPATNPPHAMTGVNPANLAYVIYTSGSTGQPKGAMNSHVAVVNRLCWMQRAYCLGVDDTVLQKTPFSFDVSVWEFFWPLLVGARLVMARPGGHKEGVS